VTAPTPNPAPALTGREIGQAQRAIGALLDRKLAAAGLPFADWTVLFTLDAAGPLTADELVARQVDGLKVPQSEARATLERMTGAGLLAADGDRVVPTAAAEGVFRPIRTDVARLTVELYGDLPPEDLEATRRTLAEVTRRANAKLAQTS
jgi:DNA-binding MarR family transcriptional regulator